MIHVLIIVSFAYGGYATTQEFSSKEACENARMALAENVGVRGRYMICVPKG